MERSFGAQAALRSAASATVQALVCRYLPFRVLVDARSGLAAATLPAPVPVSRRMASFGPVPMPRLQHQTHLMVCANETGRCKHLMTNSWDLAA